MGILGNRQTLKYVFLILLITTFLAAFYKTSILNKMQIIEHVVYDINSDNNYKTGNLLDIVESNITDFIKDNITTDNTRQWKNLLEEPKINFDPNFKNPCWFTGSTFNCLPYFFVIGVKKCGTTDIFFRLSLHPDFAMPNFRKESQWFARRRFKDNGYSDTFQHYIHGFNQAAKTILSEANQSRGIITNFKTITGEGSPSNLHLNTHWKEFKGNENLDEPKYVILDYIHHFLPQTKIIITFRDPIERLYSDYYHEFGRKSKRANPRHFHQTVTAGLKFYEDCFKSHTIRSCVYNPDLYELSKMQIQLGIYYIYWMELTRLFSKDQILVLHTNDLTDKNATMKKIHNFLGLRELNQEEMNTVITAKEKNTRSARNYNRGPMLNETFEALKSFYNPFNRRMADLMGDRRFLYTAS